MMCKPLRTVREVRNEHQVDGSCGIGRRGTLVYEAIHHLFDILRGRGNQSTDILLTASRDGMDARGFGKYALVAW